MNTRAAIKYAKHERYGARNFDLVRVSSFSLALAAVHMFANACLLCPGKRDVRPKRKKIFTEVTWRFYIPTGLEQTALTGVFCAVGERR